MSDKIYTIDEIREIVAPIAEQYGIQRVYLFGSYARGEATGTSDLDLRVDRGKAKDYFTLGEMYCDLEDSFDKSLDLLTTGSLDQEFLSRIASEEIMIYAG
ncbi:MAG: nucleotidyltransferase domain-containing protein [Clostridia bacterium]|nr:nucleotidyltransferase domain-containing protein [Clostridia bacterium]